jgi:2-oxoglutarate ferredoxin oxidoreductase subunit beta
MSETTIAAEKTTAPVLTAKDFATDQEVRWCPGCGDYSILAQVQKAARPELSVWVVSGDGDSLSIGGNHTIHFLRRNFDINLLIFNNQIYGLTKGQYSPTSEQNKVTKSTPMGSIDHPFNPLALALGADASFVARSMDRDPKHLQAMLIRAQGHRGASLLEIYQNCNIFNDGAFETFTEKGTKAEEVLFLEQGKPLIFGATQNKGIKLDGFKPVVVEIGKDASIEDLWIHDERDFYKAQILVRMFDDPRVEGHLPRPFGVFYETDRACYEDVMAMQIEEAVAKKGKGDLDKLLRGNETWTIN